MDLNYLINTTQYHIEDKKTITYFVLLLKLSNLENIEANHREFESAGAGIHCLNKNSVVKCDRKIPIVIWQIACLSIYRVQRNPANATFSRCFYSHTYSRSNALTCAKYNLENSIIYNKTF